MIKKRSAGVTIFGVIFVFIGLGFLRGGIFREADKGQVIKLLQKQEQQMIARYQKRLKHYSGEVDDQRYKDLERKVDLSINIIRSKFKILQNFLMKDPLKRPPLELVHVLLAIGFLSSGIGCFRLAKWTKEILIATLFLQYTFFIYTLVFYLKPFINS